MRYTLVALVLVACGDEGGPRQGEACDENADCESALCFERACIDPNGDFDNDGKPNAAELDNGAPRDSDGDGELDLYESAIADQDGDCRSDEVDDNEQVPDNACGVGWMFLFWPKLSLGPCGIAGDALRSASASVDAEGEWGGTWQSEQGLDLSVTVSVAQTAGGLINCPNLGPIITFGGNRSGEHYEGTWRWFNGGDGTTGHAIVMLPNPATAVIEGTVIVEANAAPIDGATITTSLDDRTATSGPDGYFFLETATNPSSAFTITVTHPSHPTSTQQGLGKMSFVTLKMP